MTRTAQAPRGCADPPDVAYDVGLLDLDGVVYLGGSAIPGAAEALRKADAAHYTEALRSVRATLRAQDDARPDQAGPAQVSQAGPAQVSQDGPAQVGQDGPAQDGPVQDDAR